MGQKTMTHSRLVDKWVQIIGTEADIFGYIKCYMWKLWPNFRATRKVQIHKYIYENKVEKLLEVKHFPRIVS